jgi:hypothetical protein
MDGFDSETDETVVSYVQVAIGFEALYGGSKDEPVVQTLASRVAHGLARTVERRQDLLRRFVEFYKKRSAIVHSGANRLIADEVETPGWARQTLRHAIRHELFLLGR